MEYIDNIDWLQIAFQSVQKNQNSFFKYRDLQRPTPMFEKVEEVILDSTNFDFNVSEFGVIGELCSNPRSDKMFLSKNYTSFKFKNRLLYVDGADGEKMYMKILRQLQKDLDFKNYHIVRLDICRDFQKFKYGLLPETFIKNFMNDKYFLEGNKGRAPERLRGTKIYCESQILLDEIKEIHKKIESKKFSYNYEIIANEIENKKRINTLTIGTKSSLIQRQLYNKTIEQQHEEKPYLTELHDKLNSDRENREIWRLEFRLKGSQLTVVDNQIKAGDGKINETPLQLEDIAEQSRITAMINFLIDNKFTFRIAADTQNKARDWKRLELFDNEVLSNKLPLKRIELKSTSNRSNKMYASMFTLHDKTARTYKDFENMLRDTFGTEGLELFKYQDNLKHKFYIDEFGLQKYYDDKIAPKYENYHRNERYRRKGG